jgi:hypothetical protein
MVVGAGNLFQYFERKLVYWSDNQLVIASIGSLGLSSPRDHSRVKNGKQQKVWIWNWRPPGMSSRY